MGFYFPTHSPSQACPFNVCKPDCLSVVAKCLVFLGHFTFTIGLLTVLRKSITFAIDDVLSQKLESINPKNKGNLPTAFQVSFFFCPYGRE